MKETNRLAQSAQGLASPTERRASTEPGMRDAGDRSSLALKGTYSSPSAIRTKPSGGQRSSGGKKKGRRHQQPSGQIRRSIQPQSSQRSLSSIPEHGNSDIYLNDKEERFYDEIELTNAPSQADYVAAAVLKISIANSLCDENSDLERGLTVVMHPPQVILKRLNEKPWYAKRSYQLVLLAIFLVVLVIALVVGGGGRRGVIKPDAPSVASAGGSAKGNGQTTVSEQMLPDVFLQDSDSP
jgi:hypothetical protein